MDCPSCGMPLIRLDWSTSVDILTCDNSECGCWHTRVKIVPKEIITLADELAPLARKGKGRKKWKPYAGVTFDGEEEEIDPTIINLRKLRENLLSQKEKPETS